MQSFLCSLRDIWEKGRTPDEKESVVKVMKIFCINPDLLENEEIDEKFKTFVEELKGK